MNKQQFSHKKSYLFGKSERTIATAEKFVSTVPVKSMTAPDKRLLYGLGRRLKECHDDAELLLHQLPELDFIKPSRHRNELSDIQSQIVVLWRRLADYANFALLPRFPQLPEYLVELKQPETQTEPSDLMTDLEQIMKGE